MSATVAVFMMARLHQVGHAPTASSVPTMVFVFPKLNTAFSEGCAGDVVTKVRPVLATMNAWNSVGGSGFVYPAASIARIAGTATCAIRRNQAGASAGSLVRPLAARTATFVINMACAEMKCRLSQGTGRPRSPSQSPVMAPANVIQVHARLFRKRGAVALRRGVCGYSGPSWA